ncbi:MAG: AmmeMemoRadiSam system protein B [Planctomycetia bacterium]|nr:AmmeMemoRadiSam system protein B [Planctomycetia bacterium]
MPDRPPAVAGLFYPKDPAALRREVDRCLKPGREARAFGLVAPHAGYAYSGATAGIAFGAVKVPELVVVMSPNHTGLGPPLSVYPGGEWRLPGAAMPIDADATGRLLDLDPDLEAEPLAHRDEHGVEVELPFILRCNPAAKLVAVVLGTQDFGRMQKLGAALAALVAARPGTLLVASSDMNHFEDDATTRAKDRRALDRLVAMDERGLDEVCLRDRITMCGRAPAVAMLVAARKLGAKSAKLLDYRTSADATGETDRCVGYAAVSVE